MSSGFIRVVFCHECGEVTIHGRLQAFDEKSLSRAIVSLLDNPSRRKDIVGVCWVCLCTQLEANDSVSRETSGPDRIPE